MRSLVLLTVLVGVSLSMPKLVSPEWLKKNLKDPHLVILEFSNSQSYIVEGHIPGARLTEKEDWRVVDERTGALVKKPLEEYERMFRRRGIGKRSKVVIYYKGNNVNEILGAVYAYWIFHLLGHEEVGILDGGWNAWIKRGFPVSYEEPSYGTGDFEVRYNPYKEVDWRYVMDGIGKIPILDGRPVTHYFGIEKFPSAKKYGHVPCSVPLPWEWFVRRDEETGKLYIEFPSFVGEFMKAQGIEEEDEVLLFCFGGTGAAFLYVVLDVQGFRGMRVYDASKREWEFLNLPLNRYVWETFRSCRRPQR